MSGPGDFWRGTDLWRQLEALDGGAAVAAAVVRHMPPIERLLAQAATSPRHFTLHDAQHSWRVAQQMRRLIPDDVWVALSAHELALLLLSAYLHDIGMTPAQRMVSAHHELLVDGGSDALDDEAIAAFQEWLDRTHPGVEIAAARGTAGVERMREIDLLVSAYVRHRHVDWSEEWMREQLPDELLPGYPQALEDLVVLCRSHHEGLRALTGSEFDPTFLDGGAFAVHRRYLAAVLRVADVLDVDPERTPTVIFQHRDIAADSVVYWYKDHDLNISVERSGRVIAEARPRSAVIHRAIEETVEQIDAELRLVQGLHAEAPFDVAPLRTERLPHRWALDPMVQRRIEPKDHAYEYVNGAFRPDTKKVLDLLGAVQLYGEELSALRELVQNALDAIRERMAWQRLGFEDQGDALLTELLKRHELVLTLERRDDGRWWLECDDSGVGMTKEILTEHYLVSGRGPTHEVLELRRAVRAREIPFERTGQFGIGVLSYFMLADRVVLETRRCEDAPSTDGVTWRFETNGVGSFGELRRGTRSDAGTRLALRLRPALTEAGAGGLWRRVADYLGEQLLVLPCRVRIIGPEGEERAFSAGWTASLCEPLTHVERFSEEELLPTHLRGPRARDSLARRTDEREAFAAATEIARWHVLEEELPGGLGVFRFALPYFELAGGACLGYLRAGTDVDGRIPIQPIGTSTVLELGSDIRFAWHGILVPRVSRATEFNMPRRLGRVVLDLRHDDAGRLDVSRNSLELSDAGMQAVRHVRRRLTQGVRAFLEENAASRYQVLNLRMAAGMLGVEGPQPRECTEWMTVEHGQDGRASRWWEPILYPVVDPSGLRPSSSDWWLGEERARVAGSLTCSGGPTGHRYVRWASSHWVPDRLVATPDELDLAHVYDRPPSSVDASSLTASTVFPPPFRSVVGITRDPMTLLNRDHLVAQKAEQAACAWARKLDWGADPLERREQILSSDAHALGWLVRLVLLSTGRSKRSSVRSALAADDLWHGLRERDPHFLDALWERVTRGYDADELVFFSRDGYGPFSVVTVTPATLNIQYLYDSGWVEVWERVPRDWQVRRSDD